VPAGKRWRGGKSFPLRDQEAVGGDAQRGVMVEADPPSTLEVAEPDLLLEIVVVALDPPSHHGDVDLGVERDRLGQRREPELDRRRLALRPLDQQPCLRVIIAAALTARRDAHSGKPRSTWSTVWKWRMSVRWRRDCSA
jgi:hypothetical protein